MRGRRPNALQWVWYALGGGLPRDLSPWVLADTTGRTWMLRHLARAVVQMVPLVALCLLVPVPLAYRLSAAAGGLLLGLLFSLAFMTETIEHRVRKAGYPPGTAARMRAERQERDRVERHSPYRQGGAGSFDLSVPNARPHPLTVTLRPVLVTPLVADSVTRDTRRPLARRFLPWRAHLLTRIGKVTALAAAGVLVVAGPAMAHSGDGAIDNAKSTHGHDQQQHGGAEGHLPAVDRNVDVVSSLKLEHAQPGKIADVAVHGNYAYLAAWGGESCTKNGVHVVDITDLSAPREIGFIHSKEGSYPGEGVQVVPISTPAFTGDVLVTNNEICKDTAGVGGMNAYDVTDPAHPTPLMVGFGDTGGANDQKAAHEIHSVFAWDAGAKAYAVMVDNEESADVDIVDITDPKRPAVVAEYDLAADFPTILQPNQGLDEVFLHDMVVENIGGRFVMLASYWDGGYVQLDVTDPKRPKYLSDSDFAALDPEAAESGLTVPSEGNAHQAEYTLDNKFVIGADEDFGPYALTARNVTDDTVIDASQGSDTRRLTEGQTITGQAKFVGRACTTDPTVPVGDGFQVAVVERGVCTFTEKVANVIAAGGYQAVLVFNREGSDGCNASLGMSVSGDIPTFGVAPREQGYAIFGAVYDDVACLAGDGSKVSPIPVGILGDTLTFSSFFDGWGYVHSFDRRTMAEKDTYAIPEAHDPAFASGFGDLSVHEVATSQVNPNLAYLSYYAGGLRVITLSNNGAINEAGAFIAPGGNNFWGVETFLRNGVEYVALSDRDHGLFIMKYTP